MTIYRNYFRNTTTEPGTVSPWYDLSEIQGTPTTVSHSAGNTDVDTLVMSFRKQIDTAIIGSDFNLSVNVVELTADTGYRFEIVHRNSAQSVLATSALSPTTTTAGLHTETISFPRTWSIGDIVEVRLYHKRLLGHGGNTFTIDVNSTSSYVDADFAAAIFLGASVQSGVGNLTASGIAISSSSAALAASATQVTDGYFFSVFNGQSSQSASATLSAAGAREVNGSTAMSVDTQLSSSGIALSYGTVAMLPAATVTEQSYATLYTSSALVSSAVFTQSGARNTFGDTSVVADATILASTTSPPVSGWSPVVTGFTEYVAQEFFGASVASASAATSASGALERFGTSSVSATSTTIAVGYIQVFGSQSMLSDASILATATIGMVSSTEAAAIATATFTGLIDTLGVAQLSTDSTITIAGRVVLSSTTLMESTATSIVSASIDATASASIASSATFVSVGIIAVTGTLSVSSAATVSAQGSLSKSSTASLTADSTTVSAGYLDANAALSISAAASTTQDGLVELLSTAQPTATAQVVSTATATLFGGGLSDAYASLVVDGFAHITVPQVQNLHLVNKDFGLVQIAWDALTYVDYYHVERDSEIIAQAPSNSYDDTDVAPDSTYTYRVRGVRIND